MTSLLVSAVADGMRMTSPEQVGSRGPCVMRHFPLGCHPKRRRYCYHCDCYDIGRGDAYRLYLHTTSSCDAGQNIGARFANNSGHNPAGLRNVPKGSEGMFQCDNGAA